MTIKSGDQMAECRLCKNDTPLRKSHIIPKFATNWLKRTSATGFFRMGAIPNIPFQDTPKERLLCEQCEQLFSGFEKYFAENVFRPYINDYLDDWGIPKSDFKIDYDQRLMKFIISFHWRLAISDKIALSDSGETARRIVLDKAEMWRRFLMDEIPDPGPEETHLMFLQNPIQVSQLLPPDLPGNLVTYLLRSVDGVVMIARDKSKIGLYGKLGPIAMASAIVPGYFNQMHNTLVTETGTLVPQQTIGSDLGTFLMRTRPSEIGKALMISDRQKEKIQRRYEKDPDRVARSSSFKAHLSDMDITGRKDSNDH
jgi:hypothetical protein